MTITVASIVMGFAVVRLTSWLPTYRLSAAARQVATDLHSARMKAINQNIPFQLRFATAGATSYLIEKDTNIDGIFEPDSGPLSLPEGITVTAGVASTFLRRGTSNGPVTITLSNGSAQKWVCVTTIGRITISDSVCS